MNIGQAKAAEDGQGQAQSHAARRRSEPEARVCTRAATGVAGGGSGLGPVRAAAITMARPDQIRIKTQRSVNIVLAPRIQTASMAKA